MDKHGSESYFVLGEGLLSESAGGRGGGQVVAAAAAPQFRFSRMGPKGVGRQLGEPNRRRIARTMTGGGGGASRIPAGFTYLGQFVDHDITLDLTSIGDKEKDPLGIENFRTPSVDLDCLYGLGPAGGSSPVPAMDSRMAVSAWTFFIR